MDATSEGRSVESTRRLARIAGAVYLVAGLTTAFGFYHAPLIQVDPQAIAAALVRSDLRFRIGVVTDVVSTVLFIPVALLLYALFKPVDKVRASLMALLLIVAVPVSLVVALNYVAAQWLLSGAPEVAAIASGEREALGRLFLHLHVYGVLVVEVFWGLWLLPLGSLVIRSRFLPRALGYLLIIGGLAYVAHSLTTLLLGGQRIVVYERITMLARAAAEFPIMLWLLIKGTDTPSTRREPSPIRG